MKELKLFRPNTANEKYNFVYLVDLYGKQVIKDYLEIPLLVDNKRYTLKEWLGKLASQVEFQQRDYERKVKDLETKFNNELEKQKEINKNLLELIRDGGTI